MRYPDVPQWTSRQRLRAERETLGLYLSGHPMDDLADEISGFVSCRIGDAADRIGNADGGKRRRRAGVPMTLAGMVVAVRRRPGKGAFVAIDDGSGRLEVAVFERMQAECADVLVADEVIVASGKVEADDFNGGYRMVAEQVLGLDQARARYASHLHLVLRSDCTAETVARSLNATLRPYRDGSLTVVVDYRNDHAAATLRLGPAWQVKACAELLAALGDCECVESERLVYRGGRPAETESPRLAQTA